MSEHPTEFGKMSKEENTAVIFKEKPTNQTLQFNNKNETNWKQNVISGVYLEASLIVMVSNNDISHVCRRKARFLSHSSTLTLSGGHTTLDVLQECQIDDWNVDGDRILSGQWTVFTQLAQFKYYAT